MVYKNCGKIVVEPKIGVNFGRKIFCGLVGVFIRKLFGLGLGWGNNFRISCVVVEVVVISNDNIVLWL